MRMCTLIQRVFNYIDVTLISFRMCKLQGCQHIQIYLSITENHNFDKRNNF